MGLHAALAMRMHPAMAITDAEAKSFLEAAQKVLRHYPVQASQKMLDWSAFAFCAFGMYAPRLYMAFADRPPRGQRANGPAETFADGIDPTNFGAMQ